jgi:hypothetical protein
MTDIFAIREGNTTKGGGTIVETFDAPLNF